jgi:uncharacterized protein (DUF305 family)
MKRKLTAASTAALLTLALTGCIWPGGPMMGNGYGPGSGSGSSDSQDRNQSDLMFVMMMIPHHEDAIVMSDLLLAKDDIPAGVVAMAQQIKAAQQPEIQLMRSWLDGWGVGSMDGMDHGMSGGDLDALEEATGEAAADLFLEQMIEHHEGAIIMAQQAIDYGRDPQVRTLCESIIASQTAEIVTMRQLLAT